jgi:hypothetical protein
VSKPSHTPPRNIRIPDDLWDSASAKAERHGLKVSAVIRDRLEEYARPELTPGDQVRLTGLDLAEDGVYEVVEGPDGKPTLRKVET